LSPPSCKDPQLADHTAEDNMNFIMAVAGLIGVCQNFALML